MERGNHFLLSEERMNIHAKQVARPGMRWRDECDRTRASGERRPLDALLLASSSATESALLQE